MFSADTPGFGSPVLEQERDENLSYAKSKLDNLISQSSKVLYDDIVKNLLEKPLVWESDIKNLIKELEKEGRIYLKGLTGREKTPKIGKGHFVIGRNS